jgi:signal transduction histidine kinase
LDFARENKTFIEDVNIEDVIKRSVESVVINENIEVKFNYRHKSAMWGMDRDQMMQVFTNIISNACAAMPSGGTLIIGTYENDTELKISFEDTGTGIPKENMDRIFQPFFTTRQMGTGTGLGLSVSYGIVKMHRGHINVKSNPNPEKGPTGTTFLVTLPGILKMQTGKTL